MHTFRLPPGPKGHFLLGALPEIRKDELDYLDRLVSQYGDIVYLRVVNYPVFILSHPRDIEAVLLTNPSNFVKSTFLRSSEALFGNGLLTSDGSFWLRQRRLLQPAFHHDRLVEYSRTMVEYTERMLATWQDGDLRDAHEEMVRVTMEIIAKVLFGDDIASDTGQAGEALRVFFDQFDERFGLYLIPEWLPTPGNIRYRKAIARLDSIISNVIRRRRATLDSGSDMLSTLLRVKDEAGVEMTDIQLRDEMMTLFFTGHETTSLALAWTWYLLAQNPEAEAKLFQELDRVLAGQAPSYEDLPHLRYTDWVVKESLRLYPPAYGVVRTALKDCEIGGYSVPAGATLAIFPWTVHRDPRYFERPLEFVPERWDNDFARGLPRCAYFPFGVGPRVCIGNYFATTELVLMLAAIARKFQFKLAPGHRVLLSPSLTLRPRKGIRVVLKKRQTDFAF
jgi:cytochrome P450